MKASNTTTSNSHSTVGRLGTDLYNLANNFFSGHTVLYEQLKVTSPEFSKVKQGENQVKEGGLINFANKCLKFCDSGKSQAYDPTKMADFRNQVEAIKSKIEAEKAGLSLEPKQIDSEYKQQVTTAIRALSTQVFTSIINITLSLKLENDLDKVVRGNYLLQALSVCNTEIAENFDKFYLEIRDIVKTAIRNLKNDRTPQGLVRLKALLKEFVNATGASPDTDDDWLKKQIRMYGLLVPGRSRLASLSWPSPYRWDWAFEGSEKFRSVFGVKGGDHLDEESYETYKANWGGTRSNSDRSSDIGPGHPRHGFYRPSGFLFDLRPDAGKTLADMQCELLRNHEISAVSDRLHVAAGRILAGAIESERLLFNPLLAVAEVAVTHVNTKVTIRSQSFANVIVGSAAVGLDGYKPDGTWDFDGLQTVSEDGRWLLLRSNLASKAIKISVLCITEDSQLAFRLQVPHQLYDTPNWSPTFVNFGLPGDFTKNGLLVNSIKSAAHRIVRSHLGTVNKSNCEVVGFALDAGAGLQPNFFCTWQIPFSAAKLKEKMRGESFRFHPLVTDNHAVSYSEAYGLGRYTECDLLRANLFAAWRWTIDRASETKVTV